MENWVGPERQRSLKDRLRQGISGGLPWQGSENPPKRRRYVTERHSWTKEDNDAIFEFVMTQFKNGIGLEKPTGPEYYKKFQKSCTDPVLAALPVQKFVQHMKQLRTSYVSAKEWRSTTGQGILDDDPEFGVTTVEETVLKKCPYFHQFDEVIGGKTRWIPPTDFNTLNPNHEVIFIDRQEDINEYLCDDDAQPGTSRCQNVASSTQVDDESSATHSSETRGKRIAKSPIESALQTLAKAIKIRGEIESKKLDVEATLRKEELDDRRDRWEQELTFKKMKWAEEFSLRKLKETQDYELKKMELEFKYKLEELKNNHGEGRRNADD